MSSQFQNFASDYQQRLKNAIDQLPTKGLEDLAEGITDTTKEEDDH